MGVYKDDTKKLINRDVVEYQKKQEELRDKLGEILTGLPDNMIYNALVSATHYGFPMPNGQWHPAPKPYNYEIITEGKETDSNVGS